MLLPASIITLLLKKKKKHFKLVVLLSMGSFTSAQNIGNDGNASQVVI